MKRYFLSFVILLVAYSASLNAQSWKRSPSSIIYGNGTNHFMGDLGGGKKSAAHFMGVRDIDYQVTRPTWQIGYRYRFHEYFTFRVNYTYALISGKDAASGSLDRQARNLSFRSGIHELTTQVEYYFVKEKGAAKSSFGSLKGYTPLSAYIFLGGGALYYNPKAQDANGKWIALRPLGTEGQFANPDGSPYTYTNSRTGEILTTPKPYSRIAATISMGIGIKYELNKLWALGFELSNRYTSSDYIDDTHDRYFNYAEFGLTPPSSYTTYFADRHYDLIYNEGKVVGISEFQSSPSWSGKTMRGDPDFNDAYILAMITVYYKLGSSSKAKPKYR